MTTMTLTTICDKITTANEHYLIANMQDDDRAAALLLDRCINMIRDRIEENDDKGAELNACIDAINSSPGPMARRALLDACYRNIINHRS